MGRKPKELTDEQRSEVETLAACLSQDQIADYFGIVRNTFAAMIERDPDISERYKRGKARAIRDIADGVIARARAGDTASSFFYLKTQAGWRETNRHEITGADGGALKVETELTDDLRQALDAIAAKIASSADESEMAFSGPAKPDHAER